MRTAHKKILSIITALCLLISTVALAAANIMESTLAAPAGGKSGDDGTTNWDFIEPVTHQKTVPEGYTGIYTIDDLRKMDNPNGNYILMNSIYLELTLAVVQSGRNWSPLLYNGFNGTFDGNGYIIFGLYYDYSNLNVAVNTTHYGLFYKIGDDGVVKNLGLDNAYITVSGNGEIYYGPYAYYIGGIAGESSGTIENCFNKSGRVRAVSPYNLHVGGIVGMGWDTSSTIKNCYNTSDVSASSTARHFFDGSSDSNNATVGGILGSGGITVQTSYNTGKVSAHSYARSASAGGIAGGCTKIENCYNMGPVTASRTYTSYSSHSGPSAGGIADNASSIKFCYNVGSVTQSDSVKDSTRSGLGNAIAQENIDRCYYLNGSGYEYSGGKSLTESQMRQQSSFTGFDFENVWAIDPNINNGYPYFRTKLPEGDIDTTTVTLSNAIGEIGKEITISGTFSSSTLSAVASSFTWEYDTEAMTLESGRMSIAGPTDGAYLISIPATLHTLGTHMVDVVTTDGVRARAAVEVCEVVSNETKLARFIMENGELQYTYWLAYDKYMGGIGTPYGVYSVKNGKVFATKEDQYRVDWRNKDSYYLIANPDGIPSLVINGEVLQKIGFLHHVNTGSWRTTPVAYLESLRSRALEMESGYQEALRRYNLMDAWLDFASTELGLVLAAIGGNPLSAFGTLSNFHQNQMIRPASIPPGTSIVPTQDLLRAWSIGYLRSLNTCLDSAISLPGGRIIDYDSAAALAESEYQANAHLAYFQLDLKYLSKKIQDGMTGHVFSLILSSLKLSNKIYKSEAIDEFTKVVSNVNDFKDEWEIISFKPTTNNDPDLRKAFNDVDKAATECRNLIDNPAHANRWDNKDLFSITASQRTTPQSNRSMAVAASLAVAALDAVATEGIVNLDQAVTILGPMDVAVYNNTDKLIGTVIDGVADYNPNLDAEDPLVMITDEELIALIFPNASNYRIEIKATAIGIMHYLEFRVDDEGNSISETSIHGIVVENDQAFTVNPSECGDTDYTRLFAENEAQSVIINATTAGGNGTVSLGNNGYMIGDSVHLVAIPDENYQFDGWYENNASVHAEDMYEFIAERDRTLTARFIADQTDDTISVTGVSITGAAMRNMTSGQTLQLNAAIVPTNATNQNVTWESSDTAVATVNESGLVSAISTGTTIIAMKTTDGNYAAQVTVIVSTTYTITVTAASDGTATGGGTFALGANITLTATPNAGYSFDGWYENGTKVVGADASYSFTATAHRTLEARFASIPTLSTITSVTVSPASIEVQKGSTQQFGATVNGTNNPAQTVTWAVTGSGSAGTTISTSGLLTVAADETAAALAVTATSTVDTSKTGSATVTVTITPPTPVYGISLNTSGPYVFAPATVGYGAQTAHTVTVTNTGNQATGNLTVAVSGVNASAFDVSPSTVNSIAVGGTGNFAVTPKMGLAAGTYAATVTVSGGNGISKSFNVSFAVNPKPETPTTFVPVTKITGVPTKATVGANLTLTGTVSPSNATNQTIVWSVDTPGSTGAAITGNTFSATAAGQVIITATIINGATATTNYTEDFIITVSGLPGSSTTSPGGPNTNNNQAGNTSNSTGNASNGNSTGNNSNNTNSFLPGGGGTPMPKTGAGLNGTMIAFIIILVLDAAFIAGMAYLQSKKQRRKFMH